MDRSRVLGVVLCAALMGAILSGCVAVVFGAGAAAGVSGAVWYHGELRSSLAAALPRAREAASATLEKMGHSAGIEGTSSLECTLISYAGDDRKITIELKSLSSEVTEIHIRVGFWGDQVISQHILAEISQRLGKPVTAAPPASALGLAS